MSEDKLTTNKEVFSQSPQQKLEHMSKEAGYDIPVESVPLPSHGLIYPPEHPFYNAETVDIRCMTARDEDLLSSSALMKNGTVISKLLSSCLMNKLVDPDELITGDRSAILIAIRITGYGAEYGAKIECPECENQFDNEFSLNGLPVRTLGATPVKPNTNLFEFTTPSGMKVLFKLLTGKDEMEMSQLAKKKKKLGSLVESPVTSRLFHSIVSLNGEEDRGKISRMVNTMRASDSRAIRKYIDKIEPEVLMKQSVTCPSCGEESEVSVPLGTNFFWPNND